jgi:hypothetical protein
MSIQTSPQFVAELTVYDRSIATTRVLRYAVKGFVTKPAETPANTFFDERVTQPIDIQRTMFASRATRGDRRRRTANSCSRISTARWMG